MFGNNGSRIENRENNQAEDLLNLYVRSAMTAGVLMGASSAILFGWLAGPMVAITAGTCAGLNMTIMWPLCIKHYQEISNWRKREGRPRFLELLTPTPWAGSVVALICYGGFAVSSGLSGAIMAMSPILLAYAIIFTMVYMLVTKLKGNDSGSGRFERAISNEQIFVEASTLRTSSDFSTTDKLLNKSLAEGNLKEADRLSRELLDMADANLTLEVPAGNRHSR